MKVLIVLTSHDQLGDTGKKTGFWLEELAAPYYALKDAGAVVEIVSLKAGEFQGFDHLTPGDKVTADKAVAAVDASTYSALLLPGGELFSNIRRITNVATTKAGEGVVDNAGVIL